MNVVHNAIWDPDLLPAPGWRRLETGDLSGGGGGPSGGLTDTQLRASPVPMIPVMGSSGQLIETIPEDVSTSLPTQACKQVTIANADATTTLFIAQGGVEFPVFPKGYATFLGLTNVDQLAARGAAGPVYIRWEA